MNSNIVDYENIIKESPNGIVYTDNNFMIKYLNNSAERLTGIKKENALGNYFFSIFQQIKPNTNSADEDNINFIVVNNRKLSIQCLEINDNVDMNCGSHVFIFQDNTGLILELRKTEYVMNELQEIIEGSFDGILVTDGEANVLLVNQSYVRNTDIKKEELLGHNMKELINPIWMKNSVALLVKEQKQPVSMHHTTKHGKNIMVTGTPIFDEHKNIKKVVINARDISEIYQLREELSKAKEMEKIYFAQINDDNEIKENCEDDIVVMDEKMKEIFSLAKRISSFNTTVLITGESGVGKDVLANYIHKENSLNKDKPFIAVNCGAIPENLLESELFGYAEGAFTGAAKGGKVGLFEKADGGTLFLDEVGSMSLNLQVKLLRALETRTIVRVGSSSPISVNIRVIAATNEDLLEKIKSGDFREDLFYRLNVVSIKIPPLRERIEDIAPLSLKFLNKFNKQYGLNKKLTFEVVKELETYSWPGSIRQLKNVIENMVVVSENEYLQLDDLPWITKENKHLKNTNFELLSLQEHLDMYEKMILEDAKKKYGTSRKIAEVLKVNQSTIVRKLSKYNL